MTVSYELFITVLEDQMTRLMTAVFFKYEAIDIKGRNANKSEIK